MAMNFIDALGSQAKGPAIPLEDFFDQYNVRREGQTKFPIGILEALVSYVDVHDRSSAMLVPQGSNINVILLTEDEIVFFEENYPGLVRYE